MLKWSNEYLPFNRARNNNNGNGGNNKKNRDREPANRRREQRKPYNSLRDYDREFNLDDVEVIKSKSREVEDAEYTLDAFIEDYMAFSDEGGNKVTSIINSEFWDVCNIITHYYDGKYKDIVGKMNQVFDIMSTQKFANALRIVCADGNIKGWSGVDGIWKDALFTLSTALITTNNSMKQETIEIYVELIMSNGLAGKDVNRLVDEYSISKDLAVDLIIGIPVIPEDLTDISISEFHDTFVMKLMDNAEENIDVLDAGTQAKLFKFFFGDEQPALKCVGRMLADTRIGTFKNSSQQMIYDEYIPMLAGILEARDIKDIKYVLKYVLNQKKARPNDELVYDAISISNYDSIRKALFELVQENVEYKKIITS